jgi:hypothetical protein
VSGDDSVKNGSKSDKVNEVRLQGAEQSVELKKEAQFRKGVSPSVSLRDVMVWEALVANKVSISIL